jgi:hypothetical protein
MHVRRALREAHAWRPTSFYMLLATPLVLLLARGLVGQRDDIFQLWLGFSLLLFFFGVVAVVALVDVIEITRRNLREHRATFMETLGDADFTATLGQRVRKNDSGQS